MTVYKINGQEVSREAFNKNQAKRLGVPMAANTYKGHKPLLSEGIGCLKAQVPEMRQVIKKHNIQGVLVRDSGQLEITSRRGRKELMKVRGLCDNEGSYSDG